ncbi:MAG: heme biosynthesis HemY N-terminal domain-containing protein [Gammaproteobacteria bacterium]|nr:heme biosynthesis HemY N-terminal domain-containing protein [Gammaproteobacteria bacterium]
MITLISTLVLLFLAVAAGLMIQKDPGYLLIGYDNLSIESTLAVLLGAILLFYVLLHVAIRLLEFIFKIPNKLHSRQTEKARLRAHRSLRRAFTEMLEQHWSQAEQLCTRYIKQSEAPLINCLLAAHCAHQMGESQRRDDYIQTALNEHSHAATALNLSLASWYLNDEQTKNAKKILDQVKKTNPQHPLFKKLNLQYQQQKNQWQTIFNSLPQLRKKSILTETELLNLEQQSWGILLKQSPNIEDNKVLWSKLCKENQKNPLIVHAYSQKLIQAEEMELAETILREQLNHSWDEQLANAYGLAIKKDTTQQLNCAEMWLVEHQQSATLLLSLARICMARQLWGKAKLYLETSLSFEKSAESYYQYAELLTQLGEKEAALENYRLGLQHALEKA